METRLDDRKAAPASIDALVGIHRDLDDCGIDAKLRAWNRIGVGFRTEVRRR